MLRIFFKITGLTSTSFVPVLLSERISGTTDGGNIMTFGVFGSGSFANPKDYLEYGDNEDIKGQIRDQDNNALLFIQIF